MKKVALIGTLQLNVLIKEEIENIFYVSIS